MPRALPIATFFAFVWLSACSSPSVESIESGVYALRVEAVVDRCEPQRAVGRFSAAVRRLSCEALVEEGLATEGRCDRCTGLACGADADCDRRFPCRNGQLRTGGLSVTLPEGTTVPGTVTVVLGPELERRAQRPVTECDGGELTRRVAITGTGDDVFDGFVIETFAGLAGCPTGGSATVPEASCESQRRVTYRLREACDAPCLRPGSTNELACDCP
jgi:hypothetical protein